MFFCRVEFGLNHMKLWVSILHLIYFPNLHLKPLNHLSRWALLMCDAKNKHTTHISKLHGMPVTQPKHSTYLQLLWISLSKLVKINSRPGDSKSSSPPNCPMLSHCSQCYVFFPFQSAGFIQISGGLHAESACERAQARLWKHLHILLSLMDILIFILKADRGKN